MKPSGKFAWIPLELLIDSRLSVYDKVVWATLNSFTNGSPDCFPSITKIAKRAVIAKRTVETSLKQLVLCGWIDVGLKGHRKPTHYLLSQHAMASPAIASLAIVEDVTMASHDIRYSISSAPSIEREEDKDKGVSSMKIATIAKIDDDEVPPDLPEPRVPSAPYMLALWFYESRGVPARPTDIDMHFFKLLLKFYSEDVIKSGITWRLAHDPKGYWKANIKSDLVYREFGNWMAESMVKLITFTEWVKQNPSYDWHDLSDQFGRADLYKRALYEAKKNPLVHFTNEDYGEYHKSTRIKTRESNNDIKEAKK